MDISAREEADYTIKKPKKKDQTSILPALWEKNESRMECMPVL